MVDWPDERTVGTLLFDRFDLLDVTGPLHAFGMLKNVFQQVLVAHEAGEVASAQGPALVAGFGLEDAPPLDMLLVPGGAGVRALLEDRTLIGWLADRGKSAERVLSVGSGAVLLAHAGLLQGLDATTASRGMRFAREQAPGVRWQAAARYVDAGQVVTAAGPAAALDMALHVITEMTADDVGENLARSLEHVWQRDPTRDPFAG